MIDKIKIPENTAVEVAEKADLILEQISKGRLAIPIDGELGYSKGVLILTFPPNIDVGVEFNIPLEDNIKNKDISLTDSLVILNTVHAKLCLSHSTSGISEKPNRGPNIIITGTTHTPP